ncbi:MAG: class I SAM-dependent methyltransferase [Acidimicrobiia bacterium]|nr:class I SAM-dependent methyltransferase [Acidimicrobiia bacterium]
MSGRIHETAAAGFSAGSGAYARGRPSYPQDAVDLIVAELGIDAGSVVVDLAAGTGKFTALLVQTGARVVAVEPVPEMRETLARTVPGVEVRDGTAEHMPLDDAFAHAVTAAQAFHWFEHDAALAEIARVLEPGGGLAFLWNRRDESVAWVGEMSDVLQWHEFGHSDYDRIDWPAVVARSGLFTELHQRSFGYEHELDRAGLADRVRSISYVAAMDEAQREEKVEQVLRLVDDKPERFPLPYNTLVFWCSKRS